MYIKDGKEEVFIKQKIVQNMNHTHLFIYATLLIYLLSSCITDYEAVGVEDRSGILVVEGAIAEEGTKINLSRTVAINEPFSQIDLEDITNASIQIIDESHNIIAVTEESYPGTYIVKENFSFVPGMKYALDIQLNNKHYQSEFVTPTSTPEIDEVSWIVNDDHSIDIFVSTHAPDNETLYCLWDFEENWELRAYYQSLYRYDPITDKVIPQRLDGDNRYYCWASNYSKSLLLASTEKYKEATIKNHKIHTLKPGDSRYSYLYSISVNQYSLSKEASFYFTNLQRNIEEGGSLFAPQPSEITGNIRCLSDTDENVIGYIFAAKPSTFRTYIPMAELGLSYLEDRPFCSEEFYEHPKEAYYWGYGIYDEINAASETFFYTFTKCVDCTLRGFGNPTKTKPDYWPNEHK